MVDDETLRSGVEKVAAYALLARHWPATGSGHHHAALVAGGFLARTGMDPDGVFEAVGLIAQAAGSNRSEELARTAEGAAQAFVDGKNAFGMPEMGKTFGEEVARSVAAWLRYVGKADPGAAADTVTLGDFRAYMPAHTFLYMPLRETWVAASLDSRFPRVPIVDKQGRPVLDGKGEQKTMKPSTWLDKNRPVEQMSWIPGLPMLIPDRLVSAGGWIDRKGVTCFNLYRPPVLSDKPGNAAQAGPWVDHVRKVFGDEADHIIRWLAHRVQRPGEKINHGLVLIGEQGVGKDATLVPVKAAVGPWNFAEVSPVQILGRFNGFLKSVILRISEARDLGEVDRFKFYDHLKTFEAAPPEVLRCDEKNLREHDIVNVTGVIITTNHLTDGLYLPPGDRRHFVAWTPLTEKDFPAGYWDRLFGWYESGGIEHVAAYLAELDISDFDAKAPPPKTQAFWHIAGSNHAPEESEMADVLDKLGNPPVVTLDQITVKAEGEFQGWLMNRKNYRIIHHRMEDCGYAPVRNPEPKDGFWVIGGKRCVVYGRRDLSRDQHVEEIKKLTGKK